MNYIEDDLLCALKDFRILWQENVLNHQTYPQDILYGYFRDILKLKSRNTYTAINDNGKNNQDKFYSCTLGDLDQGSSAEPQS